MHCCKMWWEQTCNFFSKHSKNAIFIRKHVKLPAGLKIHFQNRASDDCYFEKPLVLKPKMNKMLIWYFTFCSDIFGSSQHNYYKAPVDLAGTKTFLKTLFKGGIFYFKRDWDRGLLQRTRSFAKLIATRKNFTKLSNGNLMNILYSAVYLISRKKKHHFEKSQATEECG